MLNLKRTSLILATTLTLGTAIFPATANAEPTVYEGSNGGVCVDSAVRNACRGPNGGTVYRGPRRGAVRTPNGDAYIRTPSGVYQVDRN
jgi:hypothetical protein